MNLRTIRRPSVILIQIAEPKQTYSSSTCIRPQSRPQCLLRRYFHIHSHRSDPPRSSSSLLTSTATATMSKPKQEPSIPWSTQNRSNSSSTSSSSSKQPKKPPAPPSPSASVILISPKNKVLLLHRVQTSSSFPSAHVFPGGNMEPTDGPISAVETDPSRHKDNLAYRTCAIRELFEESGILLARPSPASTSLLTISPQTRQEARHAVHDGKTTLQAWLKSHSPDAVLDTESLIPFTHWITPTTVPKRFTTQMYIYFIPLSESNNDNLTATSDEVETMAPEWRFAHEWINTAQKGEIILFPPQFLLLSFVSQFLDSDLSSSSSSTSKPNNTNITEEEITTRRNSLATFIQTDGSPPWSDKIISPTALSFTRPDGRGVLGLDKPGPELRDAHKKGQVSGDDSRVVLVRFRKEGPREVEVRMRKDIFEEERRMSADLEGKKGGEGGKGSGDGKKSKL